MLLGILSDTHGHMQNTRAAVNMLAGLEVDLVIHCGDIGSPEIVGLFSGWPTHFVLGNVDGEPRAFETAIERAGQTFHGRFGALEIEGRKIAFLHSDDARLFDETIAGGKYDLVCYGHTHVAEQHRAGKTLVLNPGALCRAPRHTLAVVRLPAVEATHICV
jgi:putative phosphoesterase